MVFFLDFRFVYVQEVEKYFCSKKWRVVIHIAKGFTAQQKALLHRRKLYCIANGFIVQQEVLPHSKKVSPTAEAGEKFLLRQKQRISPLCSIFPWAWTQRCALTDNSKMVLWSPFCRASGLTPFLEKKNVKRTLYNY